MIQSPVSKTGIAATLGTNIIFDTDFTTSGINTIKSSDIIKIDDEFMKVLSITGVGSTQRLYVQRPILGSEIAVHSSGATIELFKGQYTITDNTLNFVAAPHGMQPISTTTGSPDERDFSGLTTSSSFSGRVFTKRGIQGSSNETYYNNFVFDDISNQFTGFTSEFVLKSNGADVSGITSNSILLINNIFQSPQGIQAAEIGEYQNFESAGVTTVQFTSGGLGTPRGYDVNRGPFPIGGMIVSVGSEEGFGYQPLVVAGGSAVVSTAGTISSVSIGNSGSGYRSGIQTSVSVGIQTESSSTIYGIGTATVNNGHLTSVNVTSDRVFYVPRSISNVEYTRTTGLTTVTTSTDHGLTLGGEVILSGIAFTCDYTGSGPVNISNVVYDNTTGIMTVTTSGAHNLQTTGQRSDVLLTGIAMTCGLDGGASTHIYPRTTDPAYCGSKVSAVNSSTEFETNVGVSTVPTFYQSGGVAQPAIIAPRLINNSTSGYDPAVDGTNILKIVDSTSFEVNTGLSTRDHFYARCGTVNVPLNVVFDEPLSYSNIPLVYASGSSGIGTEATIDIKVGQGSSVIDFEINDFGFGFESNQELTVPVGGTTGIPTNTSLTFSEFKISIQNTYSDSFLGYSPGEFQVFDRIDEKFNDVDKIFSLTLDGNPIAIKASSNSNIEVDQTLLVFINDILQVPGESYTFEGGSQIIFNEAPKGPGSGIPEGDTSRILFYKGGGENDVVFKDILETVKQGDSVHLKADIENGQSVKLNQNNRVITGINTIDAVQTTSYFGPGLTDDKTTSRPLTWCKQTVDRKIGGQFVSKDRVKYEPGIFPSAYITSSIGIGTTLAYVDSARPLFDSNNEQTDRAFQNKVTIISQDPVTSAAATATVGTSNTITAINLTSGGLGYDFVPTVTIAGHTAGTQAFATATVTNGTVTGFTISDGGTNYTTPPLVIIEEPKIKKEEIDVTSYSGDYGTIVGLGSTAVGAQKQLFFDLYIPTDSFMRDASLVGTAKTISSIGTDDIIVIKDTYVSIGDTFATAVGVATPFLDGVYKVGSASSEIVTVYNESSVGISTLVVRIKCDVDDYGAGIAFTQRPSLGNYSWGKIMFDERVNPQSFDFYGEEGVIGISTSGYVRRTESLKHKNYT